MRRRLVSLLLVLGLVGGACGGDDTGDRQRFCDTNAELEIFHVGEFPPEDVRREVGESRIVMALRRPLVFFELDEVGRFEAAFGELRSVAPADIREAVDTLSGSLRPIFDFARGADVDPVAIADAISGSETAAAGFALEEWVDSNCTE